MTVLAKRASLWSAIFAEFDEDGMRQAIDAGLQAANAVAQALGQHRDDAIGQINAVAALERFAIQRARREST